MEISEDPRTINQIKRSRIDLERRYVFLCPTSLSKHFEVLPGLAKDSALLVFKCSREWLFRDPAEIRRGRAVSRIDCGVPRNARKKSAVAPKGALSAAACHSEFSRDFLAWVVTKENEGCVFWFKPEKDLNKLSKFFEEKIDPVSEQPYRPLLLDPQWWRVRFTRTSARYVNNPAVVIANISERSNAGLDKRDVDVPALQELIYQSNPTLEPISKWPHAPSMRFVPKAPSGNSDFAGQYKSYRGYIDQDTRAGSESNFPRSQRDNARISHWPQVPHERLDNLHHSWQTEDAVSHRRDFALPNLTLTSPRGPLTAPARIMGERWENPKVSSIARLGCPHVTVHYTGFGRRGVQAQDHVIHSPPRSARSQL